MPPCQHELPAPELAVKHIC